MSKEPAPRLPLAFAVTFRKNYGRSHLKGHLKNISLTGAFLETPTLRNILPQDKVEVAVAVGGRKRKLQATIVWTHKSGFGLEFAPENNRDTQIIDDLMYYVEEKRSSRRELLSDLFKEVA